ncbi:MAG TPA: tRNA (adenosine(37)-N6)-threonylcarbamoyltransferase complex ATPase subunit type 1 TsaE [Candidatus Saccharimonadales bacterium]|nr:tRNA (adenosine(37)-N6)-threonylcarbamoyltransferase complex ATPase subunit type 1 TsaE [Candidatus Saccharimonadales bacterium]
MTYQTDSTSSADTEQFARTLGSRLRGGEVILLASDLGGGKTTFVRGMAAGMGSKDHVASPTFTIVREYRAGELTLYHFDFYRLQEPGIVAAELREFLDDPQAVVAIEWGDVVEDVLPARRLTIHIERTGDNTRRLRLQYPESLAYLAPEEAR